MPAAPARGAAGQVRRTLATLPKAHLHLHFTGSMRHSTLLDLAREVGVRLPPMLRSTHPLHLAADERGWFRFQRLYDAARSCVRSESSMRRIVREAAEDDAAEGSRRLEIQIDPTTYAHWLGGITPALEVVLDEARLASTATGVSVAVVVACSRTRNPMDARTLARLAARYSGDGPGDVVGFGLSNDERRGETADWAPAFRIAARAGLALVPHGGELLGAAHVRDVVTHLGPHRLGHGVRAAEDPAVLMEVVARGIALEVCPASNVALGVYPGLDAVPLQTLLDAGASVALGADDPLLFGSRLLDQYEAARDVHGLDDDALARLGRSSIEASRASPALKATWLRQVEEWSRPQRAQPTSTGSGTSSIP